MIITTQKPTAIHPPRPRSRLHCNPHLSQHVSETPHVLIADNGLLCYNRGGRPPSLPAPSSNRHAHRGTGGRHSLYRRSVAMPDILHLMDHFIDDCTTRGRSPKTIHDYAATVRRFAHWLDTQNAKLTPGTIQAYFRDLQNGSRSPETVRTYARTLRVFFTESGQLRK